MSDEWHFLSRRLSSFPELSSRRSGPVSGFRDMLCGNIGPWPDHCGTRLKEGRALRVSFVAEDVFHGFIAVAPVKIHSGPLQPRPEWGGMLEPGGAGLRAERSVRPRLFRAPAGRHQTSDDWRSLARVEYEAGDRIVPSRRPGAGASRLRSAAAARLERRAVIAATAVTRARRLIAPRPPPPAPRPTPVIVAIAATWGWLTRVMLPGHSEPPCILPS